MNHFMHRSLCFVVLICLIQATSVKAEPDLLNVLEVLPDTLQTLMHQRGWPSLSIAIVLEDSILFQDAYGFADVDERIPATPETIYRAASITKVFSATMLQQLAENGVVDLDDPLAQYVSEYVPEPVYPDMQPTTLRQLASHTAGLPSDASINFWHLYSAFLWIALDGQVDIDWYVTQDELIDNLSDTEIKYMPGMYSHYSNFGFQLLGIAMERAAQTPFTDHIEQHILRPLGMTHSGFTVPVEQRHLLAIGNDYLEPDFERYVTPEWHLNVTTFSGGLFTTPTDLARFLAFHMNENIGYHEEVLSRRARLLMRTPQSMPDPDTNEMCGLGWSLFSRGGYSAIGHSGGHLGFSARVEGIPELGLGVALMTNARYPEGYIGPEESIPHTILNMLVPAVEALTQQVSISEGVPLERYAGSFAVNGGHAVAEISVVDDSIYMNLEGVDFNEPFLAVGHHTFCFSADPEENPMLFFHENGNGSIDRFEFLDFTFYRD